MNHEAHGGIVSKTFLEQLHIPRFIINNMYIDGHYYHPTFLYESVWDVLGFILLISIRKHLKLGETFFLYLIWYSIGRFFVEGLRTDSLMLTSHIRVAQLVSVILIIISIILIIYRRYKFQPPVYKNAGPLSWPKQRCRFSMRKLQTHDRYQKSSINPLWQIYRLIRFPKVFKQTLIIEICRVMPNLKLKMLSIVSI